MKKMSLYAVCAALTVAACVPQTVEKLPYYKLPVVQGVPFEAKRVLAVRPGMTRDQVQLEIGRPLLNPAFRQDRWNYVYEIVRGGKVKESRSLNVYFDGETVSRVEGDALDYAREQTAAPAAEGR